MDARLGGGHFKGHCTPSQAAAPSPQDILVHLPRSCSQRWILARSLQTWHVLVLPSCLWLPTAPQHFRSGPQPIKHQLPCSMTCRSPWLPGHAPAVPTCPLLSQPGLQAQARLTGEM